MKTILLAESTGGHLLPALAVSAYLRQRGCDTLIISIDKKIPHRLLAKEEALFLAPINSAFTYVSALKAVRRQVQKGDVLLSFGGRLTTLYPMLWTLGYRRLYTYELNAVLGRSNRLAAPFVERLFTYFPLDDSKALAIGHPLEASSKHNRLNFDLAKILVLTGSLGSEDLFSLFDEVATQAAGVEISVSVGFSEHLFDSKVKKIPFVAPERYQDYDLVFARSGAGTIADLLRLEVPAVLLPSPHVKDDHQLKNARYLLMKIGLPHLGYEEQTPERVTSVIRALRPFRCRFELVKKYRIFQHPAVLETLFQELHLG